MATSQIYNLGNEITDEFFSILTYLHFLIALPEDLLPM